VNSILIAFKFEVGKVHFYVVFMKYMLI